VGGHLIRTNRLDLYIFQKAATVFSQIFLVLEVPALG
jgi:hypothetical protein